jgi:hypothetical protein
VFSKKSLSIGLFASGFRGLFERADVLGVGVGVEGRVEVDQVDRFIFDVPAEDVEVVAVVEGVGRIGFAIEWHVGDCIARKRQIEWMR